MHVWVNFKYERGKHHSLHRVRAGDNDVCWRKEKGQGMNMNPNILKVVDWRGQIGQAAGALNR